MPVVDAATIEVRVDTDLGTTTATYAADATASEPVDLPPGEVRSVVVVYRDRSGSILALDGGSFSDCFPLDGGSCPTPPTTTTEPP